MHEFTVGDESVTLRCCGKPRRVVYLHEIQDDGEAVWRRCVELGCGDFALACIRIPASQWNDVLTPWECPGIFADDAPFAGCAKEQLALLMDEIVPKTERLLVSLHDGEAAWASGVAPHGGERIETDDEAERASGSDLRGDESARADGDARHGQAARHEDVARGEHAAQREGIVPCRVLAGYSLAGLFAVWTAFQTSAFSRIASASGSLWYPGFDEFAEARPFKRQPECAYFSLGTKEARTPSRLLRRVAEGTDAVVAAFQERGVETAFEKNPGNHFKEPDLRMAKGIAWVLRGRP